MGNGAKWQRLAEANGIKFPWIIRPGQILVVPKE
jgi:nucleoid-associated protein YgaU